MYFYFLFQLGNRTILRIVLHGLGSPLWGDEHCRPDTINPSLTQFLFQLRAVMRSALAVCLITIPTHLFQVRGLRRFKYYKLLCLIIPLYLKTFNSLSYRNFSNSLIIHKEKTKEITTVKEVWICDPNYHKIRGSLPLIFSKNYQCFEKLYQTLERVFHQISKHFEVG